MKIDDVYDSLSKDGETTTAVNRLRRMVEAFATPDAFFLAQRGDIEKAWNRMTPNSPKGLGAGFWNTYNKALYLWKAAPAPEPARAHEPLDEKLTAAEIMLVAELMEKFHKDEVTVRWILQQIALARS